MKKLLLSLMLVCPTAIMAQNTQEWALVEPESGCRVLMSDVGFLLAADDDDTFSVVCADGFVIYGAKRVTFELTDPSAIAAPTAGRNGGTPTLRGSVGGSLRLTGCAQGTKVDIFDAGGRKACATTTSTGNETVIDVSGLQPGMYMLRAGTTAIKFVKR